MTSDFFFIVLIGTFVVWSVTYIMGMHKAVKLYDNLIREIVKQSKEDREKMIQLALSKNAIEYADIQRIEEVAGKEVVKEDVDEVLMDNADDSVFKRMIDKQLNPEEEVVEDGR